MRIIIPTIGTRGDVQPYLALGAGLQAAGHTVTVMSHPAMHSLVAAHRLPFAPMGPDVDLGQAAARIRGGSRHWLTGFLRVMQFSFAMLEQAHEDILAQCRQADLVVVSHSGAGRMEADRLDLPNVSVTLMPQAIPRSDPNASRLRRLGSAVAGAGMGLLMTRPVNRMRARVGLPPMGPEGITSTLLNLIPISPLVFAPDPLWEPRHQLTGYWFANDPSDWVPPAALKAFLAAGEPPVVVSLGAMAISGRDTVDAARMTLAALAQLGVRAVVQGWDAALDEFGPSPNIFRAGPVPHGWLLERARCLVHHGGFGTTASGLRAGLPAVVVPHIIDQFIWGQRLHELGVAPRPIPRAKLSVASLAEALEQACGSADLRERACELGTQIRAEQGAAQAVWLIGASLARVQPRKKTPEAGSNVSLDWTYGNEQD